MLAVLKDTIEDDTDAQTAKKLLLLGATKRHTAPMPIPALKRFAGSHFDAILGVLRNDAPLSMPSGVDVFVLDPDDIIWHADDLVPLGTTRPERTSAQQLDDLLVTGLYSEAALCVTQIQKRKLLQAKTRLWGTIRFIWLEGTAGEKAAGVIDWLERVSLEAKD